MTHSPLTAVILDWAGTTVDHGSRAPAIVMQEIFRRHGIAITAAQARGPMGMAKRDHIAAIAALPPVAASWAALHKRPFRETDIDAFYADFLPLQKEILRENSEVIEGVPRAIEACRRRGLKIGSTTGYTRELMAIVSAAARAQGYEPDCVVCAEDAPRGRPAPDLIEEAARRLGVSSLAAIVVVDDTPVGIQAGRNAGCWTIGVTRTGNGVGLSAREFANLSPQEGRELCERAAATLVAAGAHWVVESVADIDAILGEIDGPKVS